jgi:hypothetical protein
MEDTWYGCWKCLRKKFFTKLMMCELLIEGVSFLVHAMNKNGLVVDTLERKHTIAPMLKLSMQIVGYVVWHISIVIRIGMRPYVARLGCGLCYLSTMKHELHYSPHDSELATVVYALLSCR